MPRADLVRPSRDGDQFHYHWAARQCLGLLPGATNLSAVTIEGSSVEERDEVGAGEELIDVGLYFDGEGVNARLVRYIQLKHSTRGPSDAWTASGLEKTIRGFAKRYAELVDRFGVEDVARRFRFEFTTNRPIASSISEAIADLASETVPRHQDLHRILVDFAGGDESRASRFFKLFAAEGAEADLWAQRNLLAQDVSAYLPDADFDTPIQLKELVTRKATTEFASDPSIRRHDVLRALKVSEDQLQPAPCLIPSAAGTLPRESEREILDAILKAKSPVLLHADAGVGKSVLAARLASSLPAGSEAVLYDCFGDGLYRNALHFRHRHRDALVQMANQLAARGICHPLIPTVHADAKQYMRAFLHRLAQAATLIQSRDSNAQICLIVDAADNAEMAAEEQGEPGSFVRDLIRAPLPQGICLVLTCRTHRRNRLGAPPHAQDIHLEPFSAAESASHLRSVYPAATDKETAEFAFLSSSNPRLQALALSRGPSLQEMLKQLGPTPLTVERAIDELLESAVARLRDQGGATEGAQVDAICQALAVLRPLVPLRVIAKMSQISESAVRSFALDFGPPLLLKGDSLHLLDEPAETWFRERFYPDQDGLAKFVARLRPLTAESSYVAAALPQILLQAGMLNELVDLALSGESLPVENPLARRDVELQRLTFALKASLQQGRYVAATKLALKAGGESAAEHRQNNLIQRNTDLAATLIDPDRIEDIVSRRTLGSRWMGSHHAYDAALLSGHEEFSPEASSRLRMAFDWLRAWSLLPDEKREEETVSDEDRVVLAMAVLRLQGSAKAADFLRSWKWRRHAFRAARQVGDQLVDLGRHDQLNSLAHAAGKDVWLLLGLAAAARAGGQLLPAESLALLMRVLGDRRIKLSESESWNEEWEVLYSICSAIELALLVLPPDLDGWAAILRKHLPVTPPSTLASRFGFERARLLRAYALEAALRGRQIVLLDVAPSSVREELESKGTHGFSQEAETFRQEVGGLLPWIVLSAETACGRQINDLGGAVQAALKETSSFVTRHYGPDQGLRRAVALEWLRLLRDTRVAKSGELDWFSSWLAKETDALGSLDLTGLCRCAARAKGFEKMALDIASTAYQALERSREDAESRVSSYVSLARAIYVVSQSEARAYFNRAVEIASRIGDENLSRWTALLHLASASSVRDEPRPRTAYRMSRAAELTYEYVARDKHFDWEGTVEALTDLCASSAFAIFARWRDRRFGDPGRLLPIAVYRLIEQGRLPAMTPIGLGGIRASWNRLADLERVLREVDPTHHSVAAQIAYRYIRVEPAKEETWLKVKELGAAYKLDFPDVDRLNRVPSSQQPEGERPSWSSLSGTAHERQVPNWDTILKDVDLSDADMLHAAFSKIRTFDPPYEFEAFFREALARARVGQEPEMIRGIGSWPDFGFYELGQLLEAIPKPFPKQVSFRNAVRDVVLSICRREPQRVHRRGWGAPIPFETLDADGVVHDVDVVSAALGGVTAQVDELDASGLFHVVHLLSARLSPSEADEGLNFGLDLLEEILRPEDGDGAWRDDLQPPQSLIASLAGYLWTGLGSPAAAKRWEYAHVVRSVIELGWDELVQQIITCEKNDTASPFVDRGLEFYIWHARQWLLIGLSRGGLENPKALGPSVSMLQRFLREEHVLIRAFAAEALRTHLAADQSVSDDSKELEAINLSALPEEVYSGWAPPGDDDTFTSEENETDEQKYYFGIDITPYWFGPLGRAFGLSDEAIERRVKHALRKHMGWNGGGWRSDARYSRNIFKDGETYHSHGGTPKADNLTVYHGYHGMMIVAGALLRERPTRRLAEEDESEFQQWLSEHLMTSSAGRWLFDRRDPRLVVEPPAPSGYDDDAWRWCLTTAYLDQQLCTDVSMIVLWGHWIGGDTRYGDYNETVNVRSALVSRVGSEALLAALQTAPELGRFALPDAEDREPLQVGSLKLRGWVSNQMVSARLDQGDPWAEGLRYPGPAPSQDAVRTLGLNGSSDGRKWTAGTDCLARSETWRHRHGYGREAETVAGWRLAGNRQFVRRLLEGYPEDCLLVSVSVHRRRSRRQSDRFESDWAPYVRYYLMGADGVAHAL